MTASGRRVREVRVVVVVVSVVALLVGAVSAVATPAVAARPDCSKVLFVGAKGSGERAESAAGNPKYDGGTNLGAEVFDLRNRIDALFSGQLDTHAVNYVAAPVTVLAPSAWEKAQLAAAGLWKILPGMGPGANFLANRGIRSWKSNHLDKYMASVTDGRDKTVTILRAAQTACPNQKIVLAGYSQGAMVMHRAIDVLAKTPGARGVGIVDRISGMGLIADGDKASGSGATLAGNPPPGADGRGVAAWTNPLADSDINARVRARTINICTKGDVVCDFRGLPNLWDKHSNTTHTDTYRISGAVLNPAMISAADRIAAGLTPPPPGAGKWKQVSSGQLHTCAVSTTGRAYCWGLNSFGQLGDGTTKDRSVPTPVVGLGFGVTAISAGGHHTCAVAAGGAAKCWGNGGRGSLGDGTATNRSVPTPVVGLDFGVTAISAGADHTCAVAAGRAAKCWGSNGWGEFGGWGQLGDGTNTDRWVPTPVVGLGFGVTAISAGGYHTCAVASGGAAKCWGWNRYGQLGDRTTTDRWVPTPVAGLGFGVTAISAGGYHTCAVAAVGAAKCWGSNGNGRLGDGTTTDRWVPTPVAGLGFGVTAITAGGYHTCAAASGGAAKCWGDNGYGRLGDGTTTDRWVPTPVVGLGFGVTAISAGWNHTCAVAAGGAAKCWRWNGNGQLGDGTTTDRSVPVWVAKPV